MQVLNLFTEQRAWLHSPRRQCVTRLTPRRSKAVHTGTGQTGAPSPWSPRGRRALWCRRKPSTRAEARWDAARQGPLSVGFEVPGGESTGSTQTGAEVGVGTTVCGGPEKAGSSEGATVKAGELSRAGRRKAGTRRLLLYICKVPK